MLRKLSKLNLLLLPLGASLLLAACGASTPNSVSLTATQGQCVTSQIPGYESVATANSVAYPMNANLPANSPYCVALTLTNNNSGKNSNNIQVSNSGLSISYAVVSGANITSYMVDFNAAGVPQSSFPYTAYQQDGNIVLFDPNNCVTTIGAQVRTYTKGGGSCKFYLQLTGESLPIGVYPVSANVSYTNGNSNYSVSTPLNQRSNLYVGGNLSGNLAITTAQSSNNAVGTSNYPGSVAVTALTRDPFGNVYVGDLLGAIYKYNGTSSSSWTQMVTAAPGTPTLAMVSDSSGDIYFADYGGAVYQLSAATGAVSSLGSVSTVPSTTPTSIQISPDNSTLWISVNNLIYSCSVSSVSSSSCSGVVMSVAPESINQMIFSNNFSIATTNDFYQLGSTTWSPPYVGLTGSNVTGIAYSSGYTTWFAAVDEPDGVNSSVWYESAATSNTFTPFAGSTGNILTGRYPQLALDSAKGVFVSGTTLMSNDFTGSVYLAYIPASVLGLAITPWTPITGISGQILTMQTASQLTPY